MNMFQDASLINNSFQNNKAINIYEPDEALVLNTDQNKYRGGAIYINCEQTTNVNCYISLSQNNTFINNYATV